MKGHPKRHRVQSREHTQIHVLAGYAVGEVEEVRKPAGFLSTPILQGFRIVAPAHASEHRNGQYVHQRVANPSCIARLLDHRKRSDPCVQQRLRRRLPRRRTHINVANVACARKSGATQAPKGTGRKIVRDEVAIEPTGSNRGGSNRLAWRACGEAAAHRPLSPIRSGHCVESR